MQLVRKSRLGLLLAVGMLLSMPALSMAQRAPAQPNPVTDARKRVSEANLVVTELKAEQKRIKDKLVADFAEKEEWKDTVPAMAKAKKEFEAAKRQALLAMRNSAEYKKTVKERDDVKVKYDDLNKSRDPDPKAIAKLGTQLAQHGIVLKKLEASAVEQDPKALDAKEAFEAAEKNMKALEAEVESALQSDPEYAQLQQQVDQADQQLLAAKDALQQTIKSQADSRRASRPAPAPRRGRGAEGME